MVSELPQSVLAKDQTQKAHHLIPNGRGFHLAPSAPALPGGSRGRAGGDRSGYVGVPDGRGSGVPVGTSGWLSAGWLSLGWLSLGWLSGT